MATAFDTPVLPFADPFADLPSQWLEASTRAITASAELYTEVLSYAGRRQPARFLEAYTGLGAPGRPDRLRARRRDDRARRRDDRARRRDRGPHDAHGRPRATVARHQAHDPPRGERDPPAGQGRHPAPPPSSRTDLRLRRPDRRGDRRQAARAAADHARPRSPRTSRRTRSARPCFERVAALTGPEPAPGYDALTADEAQELVTNGSATLAAAVRDYERRHKDRASVIEAAVRATPTPTPS